MVDRTVGKEGQLLGVPLCVDTFVKVGVPDVQVGQIVEVPVNFAHGLVQVSGESESKNTEVDRAGEDPDE